MVKRSVQLLAGFFFVFLLAGCTTNARDSLPGATESVLPSDSVTSNDLIESNECNEDEAGAGELGGIPLYNALTPESDIEEALISRYYGCCDAKDRVDRVQTYDISIVWHKPHTMEDYSKRYEIKLNFYDHWSDTLIQEISYFVEKDIIPESITQGFVFTMLITMGTMIF